MIEILLIALILTSSFLLIRSNFYLSVVFALVLSTLLHKELFSVYIWDMLPIRIFMGAFLLSSLYDFYQFNKFSLKFLKYLKDPFILLNILLIFSKLVSIINSLNIRASLGLTIFTITASVFIISIYIKLGWDQIIDLFHKYILTAVVLSLITFIQLFLYFKYSFLFGAILNIAGSSVDFPAFSLTKDFINDSLKIVVMTRVGSLFWDVNHFGGFLAGLLVILLALLLSNLSKFSKFWGWFYFFILNFTLFLTNSRSAWVLAGIAYLVFFILLMYKKIGKKGVAYFLASLSLFSLFLFFMYQDKNSFFREKVRSYFHYRLDSFDSHFLLLSGTVEVFNQYPFIGGGTGSFFEHFKTTESSNEFLRRDPAGLSVRVPAHSVWGESLSETGLLGTTIFVALVLFILGSLIYSIIHSTNVSDFLLSSAFLGTSLGWLISGIFYSFNSEFFYIQFFFPIIYVIKKNNLKLEEILAYFKSKSYFSFLILISIAFFMLFINVGKNKYIPFDEAIYAKVAKNMFESGDYFSLTWRNFDNLWFEKPPLFFQVVALMYSLFGVSEFSSRFVSVIFSFLTILVTYKLGKLLKDSRGGYFAALALLLNVSFLYYSRSAMLDVSLTFFITCSVYTFILFLRSQSNSFLLYTGIFVGLAVMLKSVVGFLPIVIFSIFYLIQIILKRSSIKDSIKNLSIIFGMSLLVSAPWHIYMYYLHGGEFLNTYFGYHLFKRYTTTIEDKGGPWNFYLTVIRNSMRVWFLVLIPAFGFYIYRAYKEKISPEKLVLIISSVIIVLFFSTSSSKLKWYVMPIYPFLSIICGYLVSEILEFISKKTKSLQITFLVSYLFIVGSFYYFYSVRNMVYTGDLTYRLVSLIEFNNTQKDIKQSYFDKIDYPLALYYSEKDFDIVDYSSLKERLAEFKVTPRTANPQVITFITSQSRYKNLKNTYPELNIESENKDFVLGSMTVR